MTLSRIVQTAALATLLAVLLAPAPASAGCGCSKPPPPPAAVRPQVTYSGMPVTLISNQLAAGASYDVTFTAMSGQTATVRGQATSKRDLADAAYKAQLTVPLPALPLGPAAIAVRALGATVPLLTLTDDLFTVAPDPLALPLAYGTWSYPGLQAAVGRNGVVYLSLDLTDMYQPLVFEAELAGYPLRFAATDVVFRNTQGFLMQLLVQGDGKKASAPLPGMAVFPAVSPATTSDQLHYSRHEFNTYYLEHFERHPHAVDATDHAWHLDGSRHIDHDHLIVAIAGLLNGAAPAPGATPAFDLTLNAYSLFSQGLAGVSSISLANAAVTESFDPATGQLAAHGDVWTNGGLTLSGTSRVQGDATAKTFSVAATAAITGARVPLPAPLSFMAAKLPSDLPNLKAISLSGTSQTIVGPGSFKADKLLLDKSARLFIDNTAGPVTLYVNGDVVVQNGSAIAVADPNPEKFAIYTVNNGAKVELKGNGSTFYGVLYAPNVPITISGQGVFEGAFIGKTVSLKDTARVRYDQTLRGQ